MSRGGYRGAALRAAAFLAMAAVALAGCQGGGPGSTGGSEKAAAADAGSSVALQVETHRLLSELSHSVIRSCMRELTMLPPALSASAQEAMRDCLRARVLGSFGDEAAASEHCQDEDIGLLMRCVWIGAAAMRFLAAADDAPEELMDWSDLRKSIELGGRLLATKAALECGGADMGCITRGVGRALLLDGASVDRCSAISPQQLQVQCIVDALLVDMIRSALLYVG